MKLYWETLSEEVLGLAKSLMTIEGLSAFYLVGGSALSLYLGHRKSVDIDLFYHEGFNAIEVSEELQKRYKVENLETGNNLVRGTINQIKVDIITHKYRLIDEVEEQDGIRIVGLKDIAAFKLNAVANRGAKKDFWDIAGLIDKYTLKEMFGFYEEKYPSFNRWAVEKSLVYFEDADQDTTPLMALNNMTWEEVKRKIRDASFLDG